MFNQFSMKKEEREQTVNITKAAPTLRFTVGERFLKSCQNCGEEAVSTKRNWLKRRRKKTHSNVRSFVCLRPRNPFENASAERELVRMDERVFTLSATTRGSPRLPPLLPSLAGC